MTTFFLIYAAIGAFLAYWLCFKVQVQVPPAPAYDLDEPPMIMIGITVFAFWPVLILSLLALLIFHWSQSFNHTTH